MKDDSNKILLKYDNLVNKIDQKALELSRKHQYHLQCKKGCDLCCMDYSIFPVEFYSILKKLKSAGISLKPAKENGNSCAFLKDHTCSIYENRPIICRTHGLPLLYMNDDNEWELSNCELNFKDFDFEQFTFDNTFPQDKFNSELFILNKEFVSDFKEKKFIETDLISLKNLAKELAKY